MRNLSRGGEGCHAGLCIIRARQIRAGLRSLWHDCKGSIKNVCNFQNSIILTFFFRSKTFFVINCGKIIQHPLFQTVRCKKSDSKKVLPSAKIPYWQRTQMGSDAKKTLSRNSADCVAPVLALERNSVHQQMFLQWFHAPFWFSRFGWRQLVDLSLVVLEFRLFFLSFTDVISKGQLGASSQLICRTALLLRGSRCEIVSLGIKLSEPI